MPKEESLPTRKKMRKGTHSCFECRRRKIRCIYQPDNPDVCSECFARGSRCIDQENGTSDVIVDHRKNLRERVSRLEALVDGLLSEKDPMKSESRSQSINQVDTSSPKAPSMYNKDTFSPVTLTTEESSNFFPQNQRVPSNRGHHIPILSVFEDAINDAEEQAIARDPSLKATLPKPAVAGNDRYILTNVHQDNLTGENTPLRSAKREKVKQALVAMLPPFDQLTDLFSRNSEWWQTWRRKCSGTSGPDQTLAQFAAHALSTGNMGAIATVVLSVAICSTDDTDDVEKYIEVVDQWVLSDDEFASSLEGMECLILKSKWYADIGQPRRAWIAYRKGLMYAQLMGLHRKRTSSAAHESIWWALFHGDRFLSLLLGLPYGISDSHCDLTMPDLGTSEYTHPMNAMTKVSQLAGRVIDRNQGIAEQSFAWALQLDQELEDLWKQLDPAWLDYSELLADVESNAAELREKLMGQICFHQIRVYLHLPFMLKSASNPRFTYSRTACLNGSRDVLRLYQALRTGTVQPLYECKAVDFIGFTAAVLIQIGLLNFGLHSPGSSPKEMENDIRLIEISIDIFRRASSEKGGKVALQSAEVLEKMMGKFRGEKEDVDCCPGQNEFVIPYFGTISIQKGGKAVHPSHTRSPHVLAQSKAAMKAAAIAPSRSPATAHYSKTPPSDRLSTAGSDLFSHSAAIALTPQTSISSGTNNNSNATSYPFPASASASADLSPFATYNGFYNWNNLNADEEVPGVNTQLNDDSMNNFPLPTNNFTWQNMPMDIDQDWSWFLNDNQAQGAVGSQAAGAATGDHTLVNVFSTQGFTGFG
ncbi:hypothetical protein GQ44DRAFT_698873 [Phaeosphaeriaceae sp. PMI808]|nr:hypothetical protein GQ44DRAFT_698873 [Phaeosphaeriaceae sp. PMI808]